MFRSKARTSSRAFESRLHGIEQLEHKQLFASLLGDAVDTVDQADDQREPLGTTWGARYIGAFDGAAAGTAYDPGSGLSQSYVTTVHTALG